MNPLRVACSLAFFTSAFLSQYPPRLILAQTTKLAGSVVALPDAGKTAAVSLCAPRSVPAFSAQSVGRGGRSAPGLPLTSRGRSAAWSSVSRGGSAAWFPITRALARLEARQIGRQARFQLRRSTTLERLGEIAAYIAVRHRSARVCGLMRCQIARVAQQLLNLAIAKDPAG
jgi:hypothetical protein